MATFGTMLMMVKDRIAAEGMWPVLQRIADLGYQSVEVSQVATDEANIAALERGVAELGLQVGAMSVALKKTAVATGDALDTDFDKIVADTSRVGTRFVRIGMMPFEAMMSRQACEQFALDCEAAAQRLADVGLTLCYHNHHVDFATFDGERLFDIVRRLAPSLHFEIDLHWVQRGGAAPLDVLADYAGKVDLIHLKDYRIGTLPGAAIEALQAGDHAAFGVHWNGIVQFAELGQGNINWPVVIPAAIEAGAQFLHVEQDELYGRDGFDCLADSASYLRSLGYLS